MHRRQFIFACNAGAAASVWPLMSLAQPAPEVCTVIIDHIDMVDSDPEHIRLGLVAIGRVGSACLSEISGHLSGFHRVIAINTDADVLQAVQRNEKIRISSIIKSGCDSENLSLYAQTTLPEIVKALAGLNMVILVCGLGGRASTAIAPVMAQGLRKQGTMTLGLAVMPFDFEGPQRQATAQQGLLTLRDNLPALIVARNADMTQACGDDAPIERVLHQAPQAFVQLCRIVGQLLHPSQSDCIIDFEDLQYLMTRHHSLGAFGFGAATVSEGARVACQRAMEHPMLGLQRLRQAPGVLVSIESPFNILRLSDTKLILSTVREQLSSDTFMLCGTTMRPLPAADAIRVSIWAQGIGDLEVSDDS